MNVRNHSPFPYQVLLSDDKEGREHCSVLIKVTCALSTGALAKMHAPLVPADELGPTGVVVAPADVVPCRTGTSVIVRGSIFAPTSMGATSVHARVRVGPLDKSLVAFGERRWTKAGGNYAPSPPTQFLSVPVSREEAFGGTTPAAAFEKTPPARASSHRVPTRWGRLSHA